MRIVMILLVIVLIVAAGVIGAALSRDEGVKSDPKNDDSTTHTAPTKVIESESRAEKLGGTIVDLSNRGLSTVSRDVFNLSDATSLDVSGNTLTGALPAEVRLLSKLEILDLSDNQFTGVPAEVGQLSKLRILDLSNNPITGLPYEIGNLQNLERLDLSGTNYSRQDLEVIKQHLPSGVVIVTD